VTTTIALSVSLLTIMLLTMNVAVVNVSLAITTTTPSTIQNHTKDYLTGQSYGKQDGKVGVYDPPGSCGELQHGTNADHCHAGYNMGYVTACTSKTAKFGCGDGPTH
jgi:hypothetical protein